MRSLKHINPIANRGTRPSNAANFIARNLLVRALRRNCLHHVLRGKPAFVGFIVDDADSIDLFDEEATRLLQILANYGTRCDVLSWKESARKRLATIDSSRSLSNNSVVLGFARDQKDMPDFFRSVADKIVVLGGIDEHALAATFKAFFGRVPSSDILSAARQIPVDILNVYLRKGRTLRQAIDNIERYTNALRAPAKSNNAPRLESLSGLGDVAKWGLSLAKDLQDYRNGKISWADVDRGVLVSGAPGTGKTLFARALGHTCDVPVHIHSLARWQAQGHLGDLLKAMHRAFSDAIKSAPSVLFIDEIDAIGSRSDFKGENEQYCREVVNALLECLDGAESRDGVVVVAATNYPEKIDSALLRPGRLDRHLRIVPPDLDGRSAILRYHLGGNLGSVDLTDIARSLEGATGAMIERIVRDARRRSRHLGREMIVEDLKQGLSQIRLSDDAFRRACVHESGHALVGQLLSEVSGNIPVAVRVRRESLTQQNDAGETEFYRIPGFDRTKAAYLAEITALLAGLAAEDVILGGHAEGSGGADRSDLHLATTIAARLEGSLGLGGSLVYLVSSDDAKIMEHVRQDSHLRRQIHAVLKGCAHRARTLVSQNREKLELLASKLAQQDLTPADIQTLVGDIVRENVSSNCNHANKERATMLLSG
jgi:hypothetical protein